MTQVISKKPFCQHIWRKGNSRSSGYEHLLHNKAEHSDQYCHTLQWNFHNQQGNHTTPSRIQHITKRTVSSNYMPLKQGDTLPGIHKSLM